MKKLPIILFLLVPLAACGDLGGDPVIAVADPSTYDPGLDPADFVDTVDNPYFPLPTGAAWSYEERDDGDVVRVETTVLAERRTVLGIEATVVKDIAFEDGREVEVTFDWYAQDRAGNVWYLGEDTKELDGGKVVSTKGSWEAGVRGAKPGIIMQATPAVGQRYRQEYLKGEAEDLAEVVRVDASLTIALAAFSRLVVTREWNPLEPKNIEEKYYAPGVGLVAERGVRGTSARIDLVKASLR